MLDNYRFGVKSFEKGLNVAQLQNMIGNVTPEMPMRYARIFQKSKIDNKEFLLRENQENIINWLVESKDNFIDSIYMLQTGSYESTQINNEVMQTFEQLSYIEKLEVIKTSVTIILKNSPD